MFSEISRYLIVGIFSNIANFLAFSLFYIISVPIFFSSMFGYFIGLFISYTFGRIWVFGKEFKSTKKRMLLFSVVYFVGGIGMSTIIFILTNLYDVDYRLSWFFGAFFAVLNNFGGQKFIVFKRNQYEK